MAPTYQGVMAAAILLTMPLAAIDRTYVSAIERKRYSVSLDILERLAVALGVEPWVLLVPRPAK